MLTLVGAVRILGNIQTQRDRGTRVSSQIDVDARRIANEIVFGDLNFANKLWKDRISDLKAFEAAALLAELEKSYE